MSGDMNSLSHAGLILAWKRNTKVKNERKFEMLWCRYKRPESCNERTEAAHNCKKRKVNHF